MINYKKKFWLFCRNLCIYYVVICLGACTFQRSLLYHPQYDTPPPSRYGMPDHVNEVTIESNNKTRIAAWYAPAKEGKHTFIYFHGNGGHLGYNFERYKVLLANDYGLLAIDYQGYGKSEGSPTEVNLTADAVASVEFLKSKNIAEKDIILYGQSLGSGLAVKMAKKYDVALLALEAPYSTIADVAAGIYPMLPVKLLLIDTFDSMAIIADVNTPFIRFHGKKDNVVPIEFGNKLFAKAREPKKDIILENTGHNNHNMTVNLGHMEAFLKKPNHQ
jgi:fermentation-respiration switch protein FrsA (DUF1100 family)